MTNKKEYFDIYVPIRMSKSNAEFLDKIAAEQNRSRADVVRQFIRYFRGFSFSAA
jgi:hypothetical protein